MPSVFVADPGLKNTSGHHAASLAVFREAFRADQILCFTHHSPDEQLRAHLYALQIDYRPFFGSYLYDGFQRDWTIAESHDYVRPLTGDYMRLLSDLEQRNAGGVVLHHTMDWPHLLALGSALSMHGPIPITHAVFLMFNPGVDPGGAVVTPRRFLNYRVALSTLAQHSNVRMFASCQESAAVYRSAFGIRKLDVHPCFFFDSTALQREAARPRKSRVLLYLGDAKAEKGFCALPELARLFLRRLSPDTQLVIHFNLNESLSSEPLEATVKVLEEISRQESRVELLRRFLPESELTSLLRESSCVVFNYDPAIYANKTSGFLWQVCCAEAPVLIIGRSWLSREALRLNPLVRAFDEVAQLERALEKEKSLRFERRAIGPDYRATLFKPLDEFFREELGAGRQHRGKVLFVDHAVPNPKASAGGYAAWREMALLQALGYSVSFSPLDGIGLGAEARAHFDRQGIGILCDDEHPDALTVLLKLGAQFDLIYVNRFSAAEPLTRAAREYAPATKIVLNVADLHYLREQRRAQVTGEAEDLRAAEALRERELAALSAVDLVLTYSDVELRIIEEHLGSRVPVRLCPWVEDSFEAAAPYETRQDIAFLGGYAHRPNVDAMLWFARDVMPLLTKRLPDVNLRIYGADMPPEVAQCAGEHVVIEGFVDDVSDVYDRCRVFIAPLRFGAGLKGKVAGALARGVPCVLSPVAEEGFSAAESGAVIVTKTPEEWVNAIAALYSDEDAWRAASLAALDYSTKRFRFQDAVERMAQALAALATDTPAIQARRASALA